MLQGRYFAAVLPENHGTITSRIPGISFSFGEMQLSVNMPSAFVQ